MEKNTKILIVGGSGFVGQQISNQLEPGSFVSTYRNHEMTNGVRFDSMTMRLPDVIDLSEISHAIILLAESDTLLCAREPNKTDATNIDSVRLVLDDCQAFDVFPVFISTDAVFDGTKGDYTEDDEPSPIMQYCKQKVAIEKYIMEKFSRYLILRPSKIYGSSRKLPTFISRWMSDLENGTLIRCATDYTFCPIDVDDFASIVVDAIKKNISGLFHAGGPEKITYFELLRLLIKYSPHVKSTANVEEVLINDFAVIERRPINSSIISDRLYSLLNIYPRTPEEVCRILSSSPTT